MKETPDHLFSPSRQSPVAMILFFLTFVRRTIRHGWAAIVPFIYLFRQMEITKYILIVLLALIGSIYVFFAIFSYLRFYYYLKGGDVVIKKGVLSRTTINLPYEKIQTIDFKQNLIQQLTGVVAVNIDSAGSGKQEVSIPGISLKKAEELRRYVLEKKKELQEDTVVAPETDTAGVLDPFPERGNTILKIGLLNLLKVGIAQNHIKSLGLMLVFGFGLLEQIRNVTEKAYAYEADNLENTVTDYVSQTAITWLWVALFAVVLLAPLIFSLITTVLTYFDLRLTVTGDTIKLIAGLLNKKQRSTTFNKVQAVSWGRSPLQKWMKFNTIKIFPATSSVIKSKNLLVVPGSNSRHVRTVLDTLGFRADSADFSVHRLSRYYYIRGFWIVGMLPAVVIALSIVWFAKFWTLTLLIWPFVIWLEAYVSYHKWRLMAHEDILKIRYGFFGLYHKVIFWRKIQAVKISRSPFQRRKNLANVTLYLAGSTIYLPYISFSLARQVQKYALYKVESTEEGWM